MPGPDLTAAEARIADLMEDVVEITAPLDRGAAGVYNRTTKQYDDPPAVVVYRGRAKISGSTPHPQEEAADVDQLAALHDISIPLVGRDDPDDVDFDPVPALAARTALVDDGATLTVLASRRDPLLAGQRFRCSPSTRFTTFAVARHFDATLDVPAQTTSP